MQNFHWGGYFDSSHSLRRRPPRWTSTSVRSFRSTGAAILIPLLIFLSHAPQAAPVDHHSRALVQVHWGGHFVPYLVLLIPCTEGRPGVPSLARARSGPPGGHFVPSLALLIPCAAGRPGGPSIARARSGPPGRPFVHSLALLIPSTGAAILFPLLLY